MTDPTNTNSSTTNNSSDTSAHRLARSFEPEHYLIHLSPDLDNATFSGTVTIEGRIVSPTKVLELHAADLSVDKASIQVNLPNKEHDNLSNNNPSYNDPPDESHNNNLVAEKIEPDTDRQLVKLNFADSLKPGNATLSLAFSGSLNNALRGFYLSSYKDPDGNEQALATTQFEATDARRAFPCIDEPDCKARFTIDLEINEELKAVSNWPVKSIVKNGNGKKLVSFLPTMPMSTYLVAFVVGKLVSSETRMVGKVPVRVIHVPGKEGLTDYALEVADHALKFFTDYFGIDYPGEKLDLVGIPDFAFGAMENLGCITFRESLLLLDPSRSSKSELERAADVIAHEIAHMWFGDLVTMKWWNGIWLNEAFATFMELLCVDAFRPTWHRWVGFGIEREQAMDVDSLHSTRPVEYPVGPPEEAQSMFDVITYQKGASVLRMLEQYLGNETFRKGVSDYLKSHAYSNTETPDLWEALEAASGQPVNAIMESWIYQGGFPLVSIDDVHTKLYQSRFLYMPTGEDEENDESWLIPISARQFGSSPNGDKNGNESNDDISATILLNTASSNGNDIATTQWMLNAAGWGFYRTRYSSQHLRYLANSISQMSRLERFNFVSDAWALLTTEQYDLSDMLTVIDSLGSSDELDPDIWSIAIRALQFVSTVLPEESIETSLLSAYISGLLHPVLDRIGISPSDGEDERIAVLRSYLLTALGTISKDADVIQFAKSVYTDFIDTQTPISPDISSAVLRIVARWGGATEFDQLLALYRAPGTPQEENRYLYSLGEFYQQDLSLRAFDLALTEVRTQNAPFLIRELLANVSCNEKIWEKVMENWDNLLARIPENTVSRMVEGAKFLYGTATLVDQVTDFLAEHPVESAKRSFAQTSEKLSVNYRLAQRMIAQSKSAFQP